LTIEQADNEIPATRAGIRWLFQVMKAANTRGAVTALHVVAALALVAAVTGGLLMLPTTIPVNLVPIIYLIPVVLAATRSGFPAAAAAAVAGTAAADFFFVPPYYSLSVDDPRQLVELLLFLVVALICSDLAARVRHEADVSRRRERQIATLYEFSRQLARCFTIDDLLSATQRYLSEELGSPAVLFLSAGDDGESRKDHAGLPEGIRREIAALAGRGGAPVTTRVDDATGRRWMLCPVSLKGVDHGVIAVDVGADTEASDDPQLRQLEGVISEVALTLARIDIGNAMHAAQTRWRESLLKDAMHGIVSHELRTPLASVLGAASVLREMPALGADPVVASLVEGIYDEAAQLDGFLETLITASRVTADGVKPRLEWADPVDIVNAAIGRRARRLSAHTIDAVFAADLPLVRVDAVLIEEACGQLLDNAAKYSRAGSRIGVDVRAGAGQVVLSVTDEGPGLAAEDLGQLGRKSFRGQRQRHATTGFGLGLWIASAFVQANGGRLEITNRSDAPGAIASIILPAAEPDPNDDEGTDP
jgi:two-component system sensor histidine kinase KdpD